MQVRIGTGGLRSTSVTRLRHYYTPIRHPQRPTPPLTRSSLINCRSITTTDFPCCTIDLYPCVLPPLPRWTRRLHLTLASAPPTTFPVVMAGRHPQRLFEACSVFTHVAARMACWPPIEAFSSSASAHSLPPGPLLVLPAGARVGRVGPSPTDQPCLCKAHTTTTTSSRSGPGRPAARTGCSPERWPPVSAPR